MSSSTVKSVTGLLTSLKSPAVKLLSPSLKAENVIFSSPKVYGPQDCQKSPSIVGGLVDNASAARCLFPPEKPLLLEHTKAAKRLYSPEKTQTDLLDYQVTTPKRSSLVVPSFDTPYRKSLSPNGLNGKVKGFVLGRGSFGIVVKGKYKNEKVAVKIIKTLRNQQASSVTRETNALKLKHPNIISVFNVIRDPDANLVFVFMEFCSTTNLESILQKEVIPFAVKLKYLKEIGSALEYCHKNNILHLDVKPTNVIVGTLENTCKLCDFGSSSNAVDTRNCSSPTKGTLKYSAPELLWGETPTEKADIYSFGITMWQIIYQKTPYDGEDVHVVVYKVVSQNYRPENGLDITNTNVAYIYKACWATEPRKRPSMSDVILMLKGTEVNNTE